MQTCPTCRASNPDGSRFCSNCGSSLTTARPIEGERKFATVLFADVARSTAIAEQLDPEDWALIMNGAFAFMNAAVARYGGTVSRLMGDAVLALFGAPVAHEDDAERAVRAGLDIQAAAESYAETVKKQHGIDFALRVGINTGTAVLAFVGDAIKTEYTAMGDAANVAARLQSAAEPGTVLISADTHRLVHSQFDFRSRGALEMKGKQAPVESFEVLGVKTAPGRARGVEGLTSPLVGREAEINLLSEKLAALDKGVGSVIAVIGEAGLGKSRLVAELRQIRDAAPGEKAVWFESRAISYGQSIPYYAWRQIGRQMIGGSDADAGPALRQKLREFVEREGLRSSDIPFYEMLLAADTEESRVALADLAGETVVKRVADAVVNAVKASVRSTDAVRRHVFVLDDLHWSDSATLDLIAEVASLASFEPLLILCILRPDRKAPSWQLVDRLQASLGAAFARIDLEPLGSAASSALLANLLHIEGLPESVRAQILERSEGNPFYLEEVLRSLIDCGQVVLRDGRWLATRDIIDAKIPETLAGVLSSRIDRLPETTKRVAQTAAVVGRIFLHRVLETVCRDAPASERIEHVEPHIAALSYEQLVRERTRVPDREYIFKHALTCEAAYGLLLRARRRELHARTGAALEALFADRRDEFAAVLAHHFAEGEDPQRALEYSIRAANYAGRLYALREELEHRERALKLLDSMPSPQPATLIDAVVDWAKVRHRLNNYEGVLDRLSGAVETARAVGDKERLALALSWAGNIHMVMGFPFRSVPYLLESRKLAAEIGNEQLALLPLFLATWSLVDRDPRAAVAKLSEVIDLAGKHHVPDVEGHAIAYRAIALARLGEFAEARTQIQKALEIAPHAGSPVKEADVHIAVAMAFYEMGEIENGLEHARIGADLAYRANGLQCACAGYFNVGRGRLERHEPDEALHDFGTSLKLADLAYAQEMSGFVNMIRGGVAAAEVQRGSQTAIAQLRVVLENARSNHDDYGSATISERLAGALDRLGQRDEAETLLASAIDFYRSREMRPYLARALDLAGKLYEETGRPIDAAKAREESAALRSSLQAASQGEISQRAEQV